MPTEDSAAPIGPDLEELERLLVECPDIDAAMLLGELDGYLAGILVSPRRIAEDEWLPAVWGGSPAAFPDDPARSARLKTLVLARKAEIAGELLRGDLAYRPLYEIDARHDEVLWQIWIEGFAAAMALGGEEWDSLLETGDEDLGAAFLGLIFYVVMVRERKLRGPDEDEMRSRAPEMIPYLVETLYRRQHGLDRVVMSSQPVRALPKAGLPKAGLPKAGRNDPCPCGSGRKFKKCCGA
ncbi:MAG TPA: UPF0149 family protein [Allosphingosinicella sp.]|nr:UPF0149 family protein [Allosphingosinicella sp.]